MLEVRKNMSIVYGFDFIEQFNKVKQSAIKAIRDTFPIEGIKHTLILNDAWIEEGLSAYDSAAQKEIKLRRGTWAEPLYASLSLIDNETGKIIDTTKKFKLFNLPKQTSRFSYIIDGNEYQPINQLRLKSGIYSRIKANNQLESQFNLARGANFKILLNQETGVFYLNIATSNIKLLPILLDLGLSKSEISGAWGGKLYDTNEKSASGVMATEIMKLHSKLVRKEAKDRQEAINDIINYFNDKTELNPEVAKNNLGVGYNKVTANALLDASKKILGMSRGVEEPDDRDSLISKEIHSIEDFIYERLEKNKDTIFRSIKRNIDKRDNIREIISLDTFNEPVKTLFTGTSLASTSEQTNIVDMISQQRKVTIMGEGGITNERQITNAARAVHPTHLGFLDPFQTPESSAVGATLQMSLNAAKDGKELKTTVIDLKDSKKVPIQITPDEFFNSYVAFPDEYKYDEKRNLRIPIKDQVAAMYKGEIIQISPSKIRYIMASDKGILGMPANLVPFVNSDSGSRVLMATKMLSQALSLKDREPPLVQTQISKNSGTTFHEAIASVFDTVAEEDGKVIEVGKNEIKVKNSNGDIMEYPIYNNFPLNQKTFMHEDSIVDVGQDIKKGQRITELNYTKDGKLALGKNLISAYLPMKGYSFEDSIVVSETAAKKLTSEHMYKFTVRLDANTITSLKKFQAHYPGLINGKMAAKLDEDGVVKEGQELEKGDIIAAVLAKTEISPEDQILAKVSRTLVKPYKNRAEIWEYDFRATVTDVVKDRRQIDIYVKTEEPAHIGDKLSGVHGNKGTIGLILPDAEMPHMRDGTPIDIALNPHGVPSRINPGQILETVASKIAEKNGEPYIINNFEDKDYHNKINKDAKDAGVSDTEELVDPETGKSLGKVLVGKQYILKLNHPTRKKFQARSYGEGYTAEMSPSKGGVRGGQSMDHLTINALLSHGSRNILRETHQIKSQRNDEYWRALQMGQPLPAPENTFIYDKFISYLKGTGIDVVKNGNTIQLLPLTDKDINDMSNGEIKNISVVRGKNLTEEKDGLMDPKITGGLQGSNWAHLKLEEPIPNPIFETAIKAITDLKKETYEGLVNGKLFLQKDGEITEKPGDGITGGKAIESLLEDINVDKRIKEIGEKRTSAKKAELDKLNKELRYLQALKQMDREPTDYILHNIPVVPPKFRPIYTLPDGNFVVSDLNQLYKDVKGISDQLDESNKMPEEDKKNLRRDLYKGVQALFGVGQSLTKPDLKGTLLEIRGENPKFGLFQSRIIKRRQDLTGRSVITPAPEMGVNEAGIPEEMAWNLYKPFVVRRLVQAGYSPLQAQEQIENKTDVAKTGLENEMAERPILLNRAPSLHKFSIMAFKPQIVKGKAIKLPNLVTKGFNADFDGDTMSVHVPISEESKREAWAMLPTKHLLNPGSGKLMISPSQESVIGIYLITKDGKETDKRFDSISEAREAVKKGVLDVTDIVTINNQKTSVGRYLFNMILPKELRIYDKQIDKNLLLQILNDMKDKYSEKFDEIVTAIHQLGNQHSYSVGFTVTMKDIEPIRKDRDKIIAEANKEVANLDEKGMTKKEYDQKIIEIYEEATDKIKALVKDQLSKKDNSLYQMAVSGAKGNIDQVMQITAAPMLLVDAQNKIVPKPVTKSYSEGLSTSDMFIQSFGARKGAIDRSRQTSLPGDLSKMMASTAMNLVVSEQDCGTHQGIYMNVNDKNIFDRYSAEDVNGIVNYNEIITPNVIDKAVKKKITELKVRSPMKCEAQVGVCSKCSGLDENGQSYDIGTNVGMQAAQAISEPATQLIMKCQNGLVSTIEGIFPMSIYFNRCNIIEDTGLITTANPVCNVLDKDGEVETFLAQRHYPCDDMYLIKTRSGACMLAQGNHPMWVYDKQIRSGFSNKFTKLIGENKYRCTSTSPRNFYKDDFDESIVKQVKDITKEDAIWVDYRPLKGGAFTPDVHPYIAGYFVADGSSFAEKISDVVGYSSEDEHAHNKVLKVDVASLDPKWAQEFLEAYIDWDGCVFDQNNTTIARTTSTSWELTCQIVAICHKLGIHPSVGTSDGCPSKNNVRTSFDVNMRFPEGYEPINSIKLKNIKPMKNLYNAICGYDSIQMIKKLNNWTGYVYDVKTETSGFMAGFIRNHNTFHTGGVATGSKGGLTGAFDRLSLLLTMPETVPGKAVLAQQDGEVKSIDKSPLGGYDVVIGNTKHHITQGLDLRIKKGDRVKAGDALSAGIIKPQELLEHKGIDAVQDYMKDELYKLYESEGPVRKSIIEQIIRAITSLTQIEDPGDTNYIAGDIASLNKVNALNKNLDKDKKILHTPILKGINMLPTAINANEDVDWMGRMGYRYLLKTMSEGASQGWTSNIHGYHPVPGLIYAKEFGQGEKGKY